MLIPMAWRLNSSAIGWIVFAILLIPVLVFAIGVGFSDGFESGKVVNMVVAFAVIGFTSWLLRYGLSKGSVILVGVASLIVIGTGCVCCGDITTDWGFKD